MSKLFDLGIVDDDAIKPSSTQQSEVSNGGNNEQPWSHSDSAFMEEIHPEITPINIQTWNTHGTPFMPSLLAPPYNEH